MILLLIFSILSFSRVLIVHTNKISDSNTKIIGGERVRDRKEFPYQVSIRYHKLHYCGGAIITSSHILTAAYCCFSEKDVEVDLEFLKVVVGDLGLVSTDSTVSKSVISIKYHDQYTFGFYQYDIAVMKIDEPFTKWTPLIKAVPMAKQSPINKEVCVITGWGALEEFGEITDYLRMVRIPIISFKECLKFYNDTSLKEGTFCAGDIETDRGACHGDIGGPLVCNDILYGVVQFRRVCAKPKKPGVYTDVAHYNTWIRGKGLIDSANSIYGWIHSLLFIVVYYLK